MCRRFHPAEVNSSIGQLRLFILPSPYSCGLGLRISSLSRPHPRSLSLRPTDSRFPLGILVDRLQNFGFPPPCYPSYGASDSYSGGTDSHWTYQPSLDTLHGKFLFYNKLSQNFSLEILWLRSMIDIHEHYFFLFIHPVVLTIRFLTPSRFRSVIPENLMLK